MHIALTFAIALLASAWQILRKLARSEWGALTLAEAAKLSNDVLLQGVYESILNTSDVTLRLAFREITGTGLSYNRENAAPTVAWRAVGAVWTEDTPTFTQITTALKIVGGDADVDRFLATSYRNVQDLEAAVLQLKAAALAREIDDTIINGSGAGDEPSGLDALLAAGPAGQTVTMGVNGATLSLAKLDELIDTVRGGAPDMLLMSRRSRRTLNNLFRTTGSSMETRPEFGRFVQFYNGIPIGISDYISDAKTVGTSNDCSTIYAVRFGQETGGFEAVFNGGDNPGQPIQIVDVGALETKDARRWRVKSYMALALYNTLTCARLIGVRP